MSKKSKKGYPTSGVNEVWDYLFKLDGMEKLVDGIKDEKSRNEILNFTAGLAAKAQTEVEEFKKNMTQEEATEAYQQMAKEMGQSEEKINTTVEGLNKMRSQAEKIVEAGPDDPTVAELLKNYKKNNFKE